MKARVMERRSAAEAKILRVMQMFRRHVWAVVCKGVVVESKVQVGMGYVSAVGRVGVRREVGEGAAVRKGAIIHRGVVNR